MASSTTVPMTSTRANSVMRFSEKPATYKKAKVPTSDTMMAMAGISVARPFWIKSSTTSTTRMMASMRVLSTS